MDCQIKSSAVTILKMIVLILSGNCSLHQLIQVDLFKDEVKLFVCSLLVARYFLLVARYFLLLHVNFFSLLVTFCSLIVTFILLRVTFSSLFINFSFCSFLIFFPRFLLLFFRFIFLFYEYDQALEMISYDFLFHKVMCGFESLKSVIVLLNFYEKEKLNFKIVRRKINSSADIFLLTRKNIFNY